MTIDLVFIARLLASPPRATMLEWLMRGEEASAGELAKAAQVKASTASAHLALLENAGLVVAARRGRNKWFAIADNEIAAGLEAFGLICPPPRVRSSRQARELARLSLLRTCYDHLAGLIAVEMFQHMLAKRWLTPAGASLELTPRGERAFDAIDLDTKELLGEKRTFAKSCLDWTARRPHLAGTLGSALATSFLRNKWVRRHPDDRSLQVTAGGVRALSGMFDLTLQTPST